MIKSNSSPSSVDWKQRRVCDPGPPDANTFRILISTDNHLGYGEHDPIRFDDSFNSFEEILQHAVKNDVDCIFLAGDLFHDNKPSRTTLYRTISLLEKYCFGDRPITFDIVSDSSISFKTTGQANIDNPNINISLPIFSIHGNHDDPTGNPSYSTLDILHSANLINYFGKSERVDKIVNTPILFQKCDTRVALYGLGNIRDERLYRTFISDQVFWAAPNNNNSSSSDSIDNEWFNIFLFHQNRIQHSAIEKNQISEDMLPSLLDLVIWGHEHECLINDISSGTRFTIIQPGSSIATSLSQGETQTKHVGIIEIRGADWRLLPVPLYSIRPFIMKDIKLIDELDPNDPNIGQIEQLLTERIEQLLHEIKQTLEYQNTDRPNLPLIRLRVEFTGFQRLNIAKFGQRFVNKVANPDELLIFHKQRQIKQKTNKNLNNNSEMIDTDEYFNTDDIQELTPDITDLVVQFLDPNNGLNCFSENKLSEAIIQYVDKKDTHSIDGFVNSELKKIQKELKDEIKIMDLKKTINIEEIYNAVKKRRQIINNKEKKTIQERRKEIKQQEEENIFKLDPSELPKDSDDEQDQKESINHMSDDIEDDEQDTKPSRGRKAANGRSSGVRGRGVARGKAATSTRARSAATNKSRATGRGRGRASSRRKQEDDDDSDVVIDEEMNRLAEMAEDTNSRRPSRSVAQNKSYADFDDEDGIDDDDDDDEIQSSKRQRVTKTEPIRSQLTGNKRGRSAVLNLSAVKDRPVPVETFDLTDDTPRTTRQSAASRQSQIDEFANNWGAAGSRRRGARR